MAQTIQEMQALVRSFAEKQGWDDAPNIDKFDHLHEELIEMSQHLRYKSQDERNAYVKDHRDYFTQEMGDLLFGVCRLANQLSVDLEEGFDATFQKIQKKYKHLPESNIAWHEKNRSR